MDSTERLLLAIGDIKEDIGGLRADVGNLGRRLDELQKLSGRVSDLETAHTKIKTTAALLSTVVSAVFALGIALMKGYPWAH